jgi:Tol biopolymer transport system component
MPLTPGTRLGPYEILAPLGAGGMGEVYRARDTRLGRDVAIKVLPEQLSQAPEVRARFEREARAVSALNHPHICVLHDVGREGEIDFLVMELLEGETLAARIEKGPLPLEQALKIGSEIAGALDRAHRAGVVHRDLKPGNVMLTKSGAKLLDFGLARSTVLGGAQGASGMTMAVLSQSPTVSQPLTAAGMIVGTFVYMAPEQLEGRDADARTDLWALGCMLYEMTTGKRPFDGKSQASLISSIMTVEPPPVSSTTSLSPPALDRLVRACLAKDPDERVQTAHDVKLQIDWLREGGPAVGAAAPVVSAVKRKSREPLAWSIAAATLVAAAIAIVALLTKPREVETVFASIPPAPGTEFLPNWACVSLSPDGRNIAYVAADSLGRSIWVRPLDSEAARPLPDTRDVMDWALFWSHDSRSIAYFTMGKMRKVSLDGGSSVALCDARAGRGGTWNQEGAILFAPAPEGPLVRVSANGGDPIPVTKLDPERRETTHRFPCFLPDGKHFLYVSLPPGPSGWDTYVASLDSPAPKKVLTANSAVAYAEPGYLVFVRQGRIMAQRFDTKRLEVAGDVIVVGDAPEYSDTDAEAVASVSRNGHMITLQSESPQTRLEWLDRSGRVTGSVPVPAGSWKMMRLSPDARRAAVMNGTDIWIVDLDRAMPTRFAPTGTPEATLTWSPDGRRIAFVSSQTGRSEVYIANADGTGKPELVPTGDAQFKFVTDWSSDGEYLILYYVTAATGRDIAVLPMSGDRRPIPYAEGPYATSHARISPDGRWIAYESTESGESEIYVQSFPTPGRKVRISSDGGNEPFWSRGGKELLYDHSSGLMAVSIESGDDFRPGVPRVLLTSDEEITAGDVTADGERFLASVATEPSRRDIRLFLNWAAALAQ